jgi:LacI family transcriptional regulator
MKEAAEYLIGLGHQRIGFLAGPEAHYTSMERLAGYRDALTESNIEFNSEWLRHTNYDTQSGMESALDVICLNDRPTALVCANDYIAIGALAACHKEGVRVPEEMSIIGFTGDEIGQYTAPPLTTMVQPIEEIGARAVEMLLSRIEEPDLPHEQVLMPSKLLVRNSSARPLRQ